jgi:radical SAM protein with 4Fe4S-binding SPASM domain
MCGQRTHTKHDLDKHVSIVHLKVKDHQCPHCQYRAACKGECHIDYQM